MKAIWIQADGRQVTLDVRAGETLMQAATGAGVAGIIGECGGGMACATCHVVVDPAWFAATGGPGAFEADMLDITDAPREATSRLSCQLTMSAALDGIVLRVPAA
jgi:2Fe-2S ferredoxin